mmetsp:Transcript_50423/g.141085  ORF Transcript_50423/g.141085 Transcript_50423/m.141085 type:complete len:215 (+) Transcript_50423:67-711(+)
MASGVPPFRPPGYWGEPEVDDYSVDQYGYGHGEDGHWAAAVAAPRCRNGATCQYLARGFCQYYHAPADYQAYPDAEAAPIECMPAARAGADGRRWNVLINSGARDSGTQSRKSANISPGAEVGSASVRPDAKGASTPLAAKVNLGEAVGALPACSTPSKRGDVGNSPARRSRSQSTERRPITTPVRAKKCTLSRREATPDGGQIEQVGSTMGLQ